jgi:hypothetical protein
VEQMKEFDSEEHHLNKATFFSEVSLIRILRTLLLVTNLSQSSKLSGDLLKKVISTSLFKTLIRFSVLGSATL